MPRTLAHEAPSLSARLPRLTETSGEDARRQLVVWASDSLLRFGAEWTGDQLREILQQIDSQRGPR